MERFITRFALLSPYLFVIFYLIIGFITPGYSHLRHTISRLSLGKYGVLESINILQFSVGILIMVYQTNREIKNSRTVRQISYMLWALAVTLVLIAIFPTDPIDSFPKSIMSVSWNALTHFSVLGVFLLCTPAIVFKLYDTFKHDEKYENLANITLVCGTATFVLSLIWFLFFYFGIGNAYRGLFQKFIACIVVYWVTLIMRKITR